LSADHWIVLIAELVEIRVVYPNVLNELELADETRADHERRVAAIDTIFGRAFRQSWTECGSATDYFAPPDIPHRRVTRIHPPNMGSERYGISLWIHRRVIEVIVALRVVGDRRIVFFRKNERSAAGQRPMSFAPSSSCSSAVGPPCSRKTPRKAHMLLEPPIGHLTAVTRQDFRLRQIRRVAPHGIVENYRTSAVWL
jgi:hypothetical protein